MLDQVRDYLDRVRSHLHLDPQTEKQVISELRTYFSEKIAELKASGRGISETDAVREAIKSFGRPRVVARLMYEAYSQGSWTEAFLGSAPHLLIAGLFATHLWYHPILTPIVFAVTIGVTLIGWWHGKPSWLYSWIGYSLWPLLAAGLLSRGTLGQALSFVLWGQGSFPGWTLPLVVLFILSAWLIIWTTIRVVKRDWVLASLMLLPLPILASWLISLEQSGGLFQANGTVSNQWDTSMALALTVLGITSAVFIRLRQRALKVGALLTVSTIAGTVVVHGFRSYLSFFGLLSTALILLLFLLIPAFIEAKIGHGEAKGEERWADSWIEHRATR
jgi:hypothetical protein